MEVNRWHRVWSFFFPTVPEIHRAELARSLTHHNLLELRFVAKLLVLGLPLLTMLELLAQELLGGGSKSGSWTWAVGLRLVLLGLTLGFLMRGDRPRAVWEIRERHRFRTRIFTGLILVATALMTGGDELPGSLVSPYLLAVAASGFVVYLDGGEAVVLYGLGLATLVATAGSIRMEPDHLRAVVVNGALMTFVALAISRLTYLSRARECTALAVEALQTDTSSNPAARDYRIEPTDPVTGLPDERLFDAFLSREWRRATRLKIRLTVVLIRVNKWSEFVATHGPEVADRFQRLLATTLKAWARRPGDLIARLTPADFVVLLSNDDLDGATRIGAHICQDLTTPPLDGLAPPRPVLNLGLATHRPRPGQEAEILLQAARQALEKARAAGPDQWQWTAPDSPLQAK